MIRKYILIFFLIILAIRACAWFLPLQRDAIGYAYNGIQLTSGSVLYRDMWDHKPPGIYFLNAAVYKIFPQSYILNLKIASFLASFFASVTLFLLLKLLFTEKISFITTVLFAVFSNVYFITVGDNLVEGYMLPIVTLLYFAFIVANEKNKVGWYFITGICLGLLFLFKQIGILPFGAILLFLIFEKKYKAIRPMFLIVGGITITLIPFFLYVFKNNIIQETIDAILTYNMVYSRQRVGLHSIGQSLYYAMQVILSTLLFWVAACMGAIQRKYSKYEILFFLFFISSFIGVAMGGKFAFTRHYFLLLLPATSYFVAKALIKIDSFYSQKQIRQLINIGIAAIVLPSLIMQGQVFFSGLFYRGAMNFGSREMQYLLGLPQYNFVEEQKVTRSVIEYLKPQVSSKDYILNWGAEPEIYVFTHTSSPTRYYYNFPLNGTFIKGDKKFFERRRIFMQELIKTKPIFVIVNDMEVKHQSSFQNLDFEDFKTFLADYYIKETKIGNYIIFKLIGQ